MEIDKHHKTKDYQQVSFPVSSPPYQRELGQLWQGDCLVFS
jgi:hypothetical protein